MEVDHRRIQYCSCEQQLRENSETSRTGFWLAVREAEQPTDPRQTIALLVPMPT